MKISKEDVANFTADVKITIDGITRYKEAELNQELFDKVFGEGEIKSEEEFMAKITQGLEDTLSTDAQYKFAIDAKELILKKNRKIRVSS